MNKHDPALQRLNLVFIFSDQQSRDMLGAYGLSSPDTVLRDATPC